MGWQVHLLEIEVDAVDQLGVELSELYTASAPNLNNRMSINVTFCGWTPELAAGEGPTVGFANKTLEWGGVMCLTDEDVFNTGEFCVVEIKDEMEDGGDSTEIVCHRWVSVT